MKCSGITIDRIDGDGEPALGEYCDIAFYDENGQIGAAVYILPDGTIIVHALDGTKITHSARAEPEAVSVES